MNSLETKGDVNEYTNLHELIGTRIVGSGSESVVIEMNLFWKKKNEEYDESMTRVLSKFEDFKYLIPRQIITKDGIIYEGFLKAERGYNSDLFVKRLNIIILLNKNGIAHCDVAERNFVGNNLIDNGCLSWIGQEYKHKNAPIIINSLIRNIVSESVDLFGLFLMYYDVRVFEKIDFLGDQYDVIVDKMRRSLDLSKIKKINAVAVGLSNKLKKKWDVPMMINFVLLIVSSCWTYPLGIIDDCYAHQVGVWLNYLILIIILAIMVLVKRCNFCDEEYPSMLIDK
jgi:hypothetical protein